MQTSEFLNAASEAARLAGTVLEHWAGKFTVSEKGRYDLVTEADLAAQNVIHEHLLSRFPDHNFLGEEGLSTTDGSSGYRWIIDPLDGTSNYVHRFPYYAVSIALERDGELIVGVIFDPNRDELFTAEAGQGAMLNGRPLAVTSVDTLDRALVVASLPNAVDRDHPAIQQFLTVLPKAQHVQRTGSAALNLAYIAAGRLDAFWSGSLKPWDMAAGIVLVREAGGHVSSMNGKPVNIYVPDVLASNGSGIHGELQIWLA